MAFGHGKLTKLYAAGFDITGFLRSATQGASNEPAETTVFGQDDKTFIVGLEDGTLSYEGLFDVGPAAGPASKIDDVLAPLLGGPGAVYEYFPQGDAIGAPGYGTKAVQSSYEITTPYDDVGAIAGEAQSSSGFERVLSLHPLQAEAVSGQSASVDNGAVGSPTTKGGAGYIESPDVGPGVTLTGKVQHSVDNIAWVDLITFTAITADFKAERIEVAGTVNRYVRALWTLAAGAGTFHIGFARK